MVQHETLRGRLLCISRYTWNLFSSRRIPPSAGIKGSLIVLALSIMSLLASEASSLSTRMYFSSLVLTTSTRRVFNPTIFSSLLRSNS